MNPLARLPVLGVWSARCPGERMFRAACARRRGSDADFEPRGGREQRGEKRHDEGSERAGARYRTRLGLGHEPGLERGRDTRI
jgi:hypothetical protein